MKKYPYFLIILLITVLSCKNQSNEFETKLPLIESLVDVFPDSALILLDSIPFPENLDNKQFAEYSLLLVQAKDKAYKDISEDTLIFRAQEYFIKESNYEKTALSYFYSGRVYQTRKEREKAMKSYLNAETYAKFTDDNNLKGLIQFFMGDMNYNQSLLEDAIVRFKNANNYFQNSQSEKKYKNQIVVFNSIGNSFILNEQIDSAFYYYNVGLDLAVFEKDSIDQANILQNIGVIYSEISDYKNALDKFKQALVVESNEKDRARTYFNIAESYNHLNQKDSSAYYINLSHLVAEKTKDYPLLANISKYLSDTEKQNGNCDKALDYYSQYNQYLTTILEDRKDFFILDVQKKYDFEKIENSNNRLTIEKQGLIIIALFLFIVVVAIILLYKRKMKNERESRFEAEQKIEHLEKLAEIAKSEDDPIRNLLVQRFDVLKKTALLQGYLREDQKEQGKQILRKFNEIIYGQENGFDWDTLYQSMNELENGELEKIREDYPQLDETEFRICCLSKARFTNTEIAIIMNINTNAVQIRKTRIRKKLNIKEFENLAVYFNQ